MPQFVTSRRVEFAHTDMAGIVHFSNYYKWMEEAEHDFFRSIDQRIVTKQTDGTYIGWPRVNASCQFLAPARYDDLLELRIEIERIGVKSVSYCVEFWKDDSLLAKGRMKVACCRFFEDGTLKSIEIPAEIRKVLSPFAAMS